jgi:hypothetical protein
VDDPSTTAATLDQAEADEDILTYEVSDEALEAAGVGWKPTWYIATPRCCAQ